MHRKGVQKKNKKYIHRGPLQTLLVSTFEMYSDSGIRFEEPVACHQVARRIQRAVWPSCFDPNMPLRASDDLTQPNASPGKPQTSSRTISSLDFEELKYL